MISINRCSLLIGAVVFTLAGCTHRLEIKNLAQYRATDIAPLHKRVSIGIVSTEENHIIKQLIRQVGTDLQKYSGEVIYPYFTTSVAKVDVTADVRITPEYKGSGANFFINFPGFLIWAPAWHGYNYKVIYNIDVTLVDTAKNEKIDSFSNKISLDVRHAEIDRTWTEISWFEVGAIALIGGLYNMSYDPDVTPLVADESRPTIGEYIASEIVSRINASGRFAFFIQYLEKSSQLAMNANGLVPHWQ